MTLTRERPVVTPTQKIPPRPTRTPVRWLGWMVGFLVVAAGAALVVMAFNGGESFEELYEAESGLTIGQIHEPGYEAPTWFVGQSDMTLEEFEALMLDEWVADYLAESQYGRFEAGESYFVPGAIHEPGYEAPTLWIGQSDMTLEEFEASLSSENLPDHLAPSIGG